MRNPWFTEADLAEVDVLALALVDMIESHRCFCNECREAGSCGQRVELVEEAIAWTERRAPTSKALTLRARELVRGNGRADA
jgi:hypothetical protein